MSLCDYEDATRTPSEQLQGPSELPVTLSFNETAYASVLATPEALEHWAVGFAFSEGMITQASQVGEITIDRLRHGVRVRMSVCRFTSSVWPASDGALRRPPRAAAGAAAPRRRR